ncbi:hypothetical protein H9L13_06835 [Sphingomonas lutea]|uniref:Uncharacterized protein n=1 Tax=Sphingomonas lutea TaxID=1045317 RepID=A0A7G9SF22_9SPHN|nr:hypothetical protein [Sphingomonas lutea]QNN66447.1 hypothetical protein H9L13_06835 [Sphingomonas lutea]
MPTTISRSRSGALPFCISATAWVDLLGYGSMIADAELNPIDPRAKEAVTRLRTFHRIVADHSGRYYRTLVINDGAVAYRDLSLRDNGVTHDFLQRSQQLFEAISENEDRNRWPGARMVLGLGFRARGSRRAIDDAERRVGMILAELTAGKVSAAEAVRQAASIQRYSDGIPQLQANFAFTRSYVADSAGSRAGLGGPSMFVDTAMFEDGVPPKWVKCGSAIVFREPRLAIDCSFVAVTGLTAPGKKDDRIPGLRDGLEIGEAIAPTIALRTLLRTSR